nr:hypothetical protein [Tanacetum cinerariifolium]
MMKEKKPLIDLNAKCSLEITEDVEVENRTESQTPDKFDIAHIEIGNINISELANQKMGGNYLYVGYRPMFSKVVGSKYGLRHAFVGHGSGTLFNTGHSGSLELVFACHFLKTKLILDFENSAIRLLTVNDDGGVTNIASPFTHPKGYTLAFDGEHYVAHSVCDRIQQKNDFSVPKGVFNECIVVAISSLYVLFFVYVLLNIHSVHGRRLTRFYFYDFKKRNQKSYGKVVNKMVSARPCVRQPDGSQSSASQTDKKVSS